MKTIKTRSAALAASFACLFAGFSALAHEDDGKVRDKQRPVLGKPWRAEIEGAKGQDGGLAGGGFNSQNVALRSWFPLNTIDAAATSGNDCWGYVTPTGREIALVGVNTGTGVFNISNPGNAIKIGFIPGPNSLWRDIKVYGSYAYVVSEGGGGIQVVDLSMVGSGTVSLANTITTGGGLATHNVALNTQSGYLYRCGGGSSGLRMYSLINPVAPQFVGEWNAYYVHDAQVVSYTSGPYAGKEIAFCCGGLNGGNAETGLYIVDVTVKSAPVLISRILYPTARYSHQGWLTEDRKYFLLGDELDEGATQPFTTTHVIDVQNLSAPTYVGQFGNQTPAITHNCYTHQGKMFAANYRSGLRVFNVASMPNLSTATEVGFFDTYPTDDAAQFNGLWSCYPYFPSGTIIGSDLERGLFVWRLGGPVATFGLASAEPALVNPAGGTSVDVTISPGEGQTLDTSTAVMKVTSLGVTTSVPLAPLGGNVFRGTFPATTCAKPVTYQFEVANTSGEAVQDTLRSTFSAVAVTTAVNDAFEAASAWTGGVAGDTAISGQWVRVDPVATTAQPEDDHTPAPGVNCWITGNGTVGGAAGAADVDGGVTTLLSPAFDMSSMDEPSIEAWVWYSNNLGGAPNEDSMPIEISNNGGTSWTLIENYNANNGAWTKKSWRVRDYVTPSANVQMRFIARDLNTGSLVEAGVDDFKVIDVDCSAAVPGDLNGDGVVNAADLALLLNAWGSTNPAADLNDDGIVNGVDLGILLNAWG